MEQGPSWEADSFLASQEIHILQNLKVHYYIHNSPPPVSILSQINPVHAPLPLSHFLKNPMSLFHLWGCTKTSVQD